MMSLMVQALNAVLRAKSALLNGALVEAIRFQKGEPDMVALYEKLYTQSMLLLRNLGAGRLETDTYRSGVVRVPPN